MNIAAIDGLRRHRAPTVCAIERIDSSSERRGHAAVVVWALVVFVALVWGRGVVDDPGQSIGAAPFSGRWDWHPQLWLLPAIAFGAMVAVVGPRVTGGFGRWSLALAAAGTATTWSVLLAAADGWARVSAPPASRHGYVPFAATVDDPLEFLRSFTERASEYPVHVQGHPPGATLAFWLLDRMGLGGAGWAAALVVVGWGVAAAAVVVSIDELGGRDAARRAAPFLALLPAAVWATSADALFAGVVAGGGAVLVLSTGARTGTSPVLAACGGALLGIALYLTYGAVLLLAVPAAVVVWRRRWDVVVPAALGAAAVTVLAVAAGFWWFDGLETTRAAYWAGVASLRPWPYYLVAGNPGALALAAGPALAYAAGLARRSTPGWWVLAAAAAGAVALADLSQLSKGEVERIWLPFVPWLASVAAFVPAARQRRWLGVQVASALALQASLRSPW